MRKYVKSINGMKKVKICLKYCKEDIWMAE